jgi:hypothetical protein
MRIEHRLLLSHRQVERAEPAVQEPVEGADTMLKGAILKALFSDDSGAKLVRNGVVNCCKNHASLCWSLGFVDVEAKFVALR